MVYPLPYYRYLYVLLEDVLTNNSFPTLSLNFLHGDTGKDWEMKAETKIRSGKDREGGRKRVGKREQAGSRILICLFIVQLWCFSRCIHCIPDSTYWRMWAFSIETLFNTRVVVGNSSAHIELKTLWSLGGVWWPLAFRCLLCSRYPTVIAIRKMFEYFDPQ